MSVQKSVTLPPEQAKFVEDACLNLSRVVQKRLKELMVHGINPGSQATAPHAEGDSDGE